MLYALSFQLQRPVEPFLVKSLASQGDPAEVARTYGQLQSFFNAAQTIGSPLVGILLDKIGIRKASAVVFAATALSYAVLAYATDLNLLFLSKVPTVLQAAFLVAQATAATATEGDAAARAKALGRMTTAYTCGATIGPALGGYLADRGDLYFSAKIAVVGSLVSVILSLMYLPDANAPAPDNEKDERDEASSSSFSESLRNSLAIGLRASVWPLLLVKLIGGVVASIHSTALPLVLTQKVNFEASQLGVSMSTSMFAVATFAAFFMAPLAAFVGPVGMAKLGLLGRALTAPIVAIVVSAATGNDRGVVMQIATASMFHALSAHTLATGLTTQTTGAVKKDEQGTLLGLEHSLFSLARIAGPSIGTMLLAWSSDGGFWYVASCCAAIDLVLLVSLMAQTRQQHKHKPS